MNIPGLDIELAADRYEELEELISSEVLYDDFDEDEDEDFVGFDDDFPMMLEYEDDYYDEFYNDY